MRYATSNLLIVDLGRQGENLARTIEFDVSDMLTEWPGATIKLAVRRKYDDAPYLAETRTEGNVLYWPITYVDTAYPGGGQLEIRAYSGETLVKSVMGKTYVQDSLTSNHHNPPDPSKWWVDRVMEAADNAIAATDAASEAAVSANTAATAANTAAAAANSAAAKAENAVAPVISEIDFLHPLSITKFTVTPSMAEKGSTVTQETFSYGVNRLNVSLSLEGEAVTGQSATRTDSLTADKTYTLSATLGSASISATATVSFVAPVYYGVSASYALTNETVLALTRELTKSRARTISVNAGAGQYILYALPAAMGTPVFKVGGFEGGFALVGTFDFTNASGHAERYSLYCSVNAGLGSTTVTIS